MKTYRTATHPEFMREVIAPAIEKAGLPAELAPGVARLVDLGHSVDAAIDSLRRVLDTYQDQP